MSRGCLFHNIWKLHYHYTALTLPFVFQSLAAAPLPQPSLGWGGLLSSCLLAGAPQAAHATWFSGQGPPGLHTPRPRGVPGRPRARFDSKAGLTGPHTCRRALGDPIWGTAVQRAGRAPEVERRGGGPPEGDPIFYRFKSFPRLCHVGGADRHGLLEARALACWLCPPMAHACLTPRPPGHFPGGPSGLLPGGLVEDVVPSTRSERGSCAPCSDSGEGSSVCFLEAQPWEMGPESVCHLEAQPQKAGA